MSATTTAHDAPTVVIADDHPVIRLGVRMALMRGGFAVVAEAADADGAVSAVLRERPDVCLLDVNMPGGGIAAASKVAEKSPATSIVMLTVSDSAEDVLAALRAGAIGYLPKDTRPDRLPAALCGVLKGEAALPRALVGVVLHRFRDYTSAVADPIRVGEVRAERPGVRDPAHAPLGIEDRRDRRHSLALPGHRPPPHLRRRGQARCRRPRRGDPRDRARGRPRGQRSFRGRLRAS